MRDASIRVRYYLDMEIRHLSVDESKIAEFCERWGIAELAAFGSVLRDDFHENSDVDLLVTWRPGAHRTIFDVVHMKDELEQLLGRRIDLLQRQLVETDYNEFRRSAILDGARTLYAAA